MHAIAATGSDDVTQVGRAPGEALTAAARRFELPALLRVLRRRGYAAEDILFESVRDAPASPGVIDSLRFDSDPRRVTIRLSAGLLAPDGPLPSYFARFLRDLDDPRPYLAFLRFFDHVVAANLSYVASPVDGVAHGSPLARAYQTIGGARSPARIHALLRAIIPELALEVRPATLVRDEANDPARLGVARLDGTAIVGWSQRVAAAGLVARFHAELEHDDRGRPWVDVVRERCTRVLGPLLRRGGRTVEIRLHITSYTGRAQLGLGTRLGVQPIQPVEAPEPPSWEVPVLRMSARGVAA